MTIAIPVTNARQYYINGLRLTYLTTATISVTAGKCSDSTNTNDIVVGLPLNVAATDSGTEPVPAGTGSVVINTANNGAGGLDSGTIASSTFYAVYAIGDSTGVNPGSALISANLVTPILPVGYDMYFRIGYIKTDGSSNVIAFRQDGCGLDRWMWYDFPIQTNITSGNSATFAPVDCSASLPTNLRTNVVFYCFFTPTAASDQMQLRPGTSSSSFGYAAFSGSVGAVATVSYLTCPTDSPNTAAIDYKVTGSATSISIQAYLDSLALSVVA